MENEGERLTVEQINALPLAQRSAAFALLEQELRKTLDDQR